MYFSLKGEPVFTWHLEGDDILQQTIILGLFSESVRSQSELILLHSGDPECSSQTISTVAHRFSCGELSHGRKLSTRDKKVTGGNTISYVEDKKRRALKSTLTN